VLLGSHIRQYAVVNVVSADSTAFEYCQDCSANITVKYGTESTVTNQPMELLDTGLFGYRADPPKFIVGRTYTVKIETVSPTYGRGIVYSDATIVSTASASSEISAPAPQGWFVDTVKNVTGDTICVLMPSICQDEQTKDTVLSPLELPFALLGALEDVGSVINDVFRGLKDWTVLFLRADTRTNAIGSMTSYFMGLFWSFMVYFLPFVLILELFVIIKCQGQRGTNFLSAYVNTHIDFFHRAFGIFHPLFNLFMDVLRLGWDIVMGVLGWIKFW